MKLILIEFFDLKRILGRKVCVLRKAFFFIFYRVYHVTNSHINHEFSDNYLILQKIYVD